MKAKIIDIARTGGASDLGAVIQINNHKIRYGYADGDDGICDAHQTFNCIKALTEEEKKAILFVLPIQLVDEVHCMNNNIQQC